jgi:hypothetical protein
VAALGADPAPPAGHRPPPAAPARTCVTWPAGLCDTCAAAATPDWPRDLAERLYLAWRTSFGADDPHTLWVGTSLGRILTGDNGYSARTTSTASGPSTTSPATCARWASSRPRYGDTRTPSPTGGEPSATIIRLPSTRPTSWATGCAPRAGRGRPQTARGQRRPGAPGARRRSCLCHRRTDNALQRPARAGRR